MSSYKVLGIEEIFCGKDAYQFKADFAFVAALEQEVGDPMLIYEEVDFA